MPVSHFVLILGLVLAAGGLTAAMLAGLGAAVLVPAGVALAAMRLSLWK